MGFSGAFGQDDIRNPKIFDLRFNPVGLWNFDANFGDVSPTNEPFVQPQPGFEYWTGGHAPFTQAVYIENGGTGLSGASSPAPAALRVTGDVTIQAVIKVDTLVSGATTYGSTIAACVGDTSSTASAENALYGLRLRSTFTGTPQRLVPEFFWEDGATEIRARNDAFELAPHTWYHIVGTRESVGGGLSVGRLFVNGIQVAATSGADANDGANATMLIGQRLGEALGGWGDWVMSGLKIIDRQLTPGEIRAEWNRVAGLEIEPVVIGTIPEEFSPAGVAGATFSGSADTVVLNPTIFVEEMINQVLGSPNQMRQPSSSFRPTQVTVNSKLAFHCGSGGTLDDLEANGNAGNFITSTQWHIFTVVRFDAITALASEDPDEQHNLWGGKGTIFSNFALTLHDDGGVDYAQGYAFNGTSNITVRTTYPVADPDFHIIEFWNDGINMGIRLDDNAPVTTPWSGAIPSFSGSPRIGSKNFQGAWDTTSNVMSEMHIYNTFLGTTERDLIRQFLADKGYGFSV